MSSDARLQAAEAFWRDTDSPEIEAQHAEAIVALAQRLKFRPRSLQSLPVERRARFLAQAHDVSDAVATRALIALHFATRRPLMAAFLDQLGIAHDDGLITEENVAAPSADRLAAAFEAMRSSFPAEEVDLYMRTLVALDGGTWQGLESLLGSPR